MVVSGPPDKGCDVTDGELTHDYLDENDSENFAVNNDIHISLKLGVIL